MIYPEEITTEGRTPQEELTFLAWQGRQRTLCEMISLKKYRQAFSMN